MEDVSIKSNVGLLAEFPINSNSLPLNISLKYCNSLSLYGSSSLIPLLPKIFIFFPLDEAYFERNCKKFFSDSS